MADKRDGQNSPSGSRKCENDDRARIERQIESLLATEEDVTVLHNRLFSQAGLFHQLAPTTEERQKQKESPPKRPAKRLVRRITSAAANTKQSDDEGNNSFVLVKMSLPG